MRVLRPALVLLAAFALSLSFAIPAEDVPETAYDECESLPYETAPLLSDELVQESASAHQVVPTGLRHSLSAPGDALGKAGHRALAAHLISDSLITLDHSLRC